MVILRVAARIVDLTIRIAPPFGCGSGSCHLTRIVLRQRLKRVRHWRMTGYIRPLLCLVQPPPSARHYVNKS